MLTSYEMVFRKIRRRTIREKVWKREEDFCLGCPVLGATDVFQAQNLSRQNYPIYCDHEFPLFEETESLRFLP